MTRLPLPSLLLFLLPLLPISPLLSWPFLSILAFPLPLQMEKLLLPAVDLEQWYQELMAGLGTGLAAVSPRSSPPPLPAKASRQLQVTFTACLPQVLFLSVLSTCCQSFRHNVYLGSRGYLAGQGGAWKPAEGNQGLFPGSHLAILTLWEAGGFGTLVQGDRD